MWVWDYEFWFWVLNFGFGLWALELWFGVYGGCGFSGVRVWGLGCGVWGFRRVWGLGLRVSGLGFGFRL